MTNQKEIPAAEGSSRRLVWVDVCKGITIFLMILGHISGIPALLRSVIFSFHMPLFFIINGFLIRHYRIRDTFARSVKTLLKPYLVICLVEAVLAAWRMDSFPDAGAKFFSCLNDMVVGMSKTSTAFQEYGSVWLVWFVGCLFVARNLYVLIRNLPVEKSIQNLILLAVSAAGCLIGQKVAFLPWSLDVAMASVVFIAAGNALSGLKLSGKQVALASVAAAGIWVFLLSRGGQLELATRQYPLGALCFVCALAGSFLVIQLSKCITKVPGFRAFWAWMGKNSLVILAVHCLEMRFFRWEEWVYRPLGLSSPGWPVVFLLHAALILLATRAYLGLKNCLKQLNERIRSDETQQSGRLDWPDVAKGICMLSVILGHMGSSWLNRIVFMYDLPVFFLIAGYFLKKKSGEWAFIRGKAKRLLIPYAVTCCLVILIAVVQAFLAGESASAAFRTWGIASLYGAGDSWSEPFQVKGIGAVWFLLALFLALVIVHFFAERKYYQWIVAGIAFAGWLSFDRTNVWLPLSIQAGMLASLYVLIGYEGRKRGFTVRSAGAGVWLTLFLLAVLSIQQFSGFWLVHNYLGNGWLDLFGSLAAALVVIAFSMHLCKGGEILKRILLFFGRNSLVILCAHLIELNVLKLKPLSDSFSAAMGLNHNHSTLLLILLKILFVACAALLTNWITRLPGNLRRRRSPE